MAAGNLNTPSNLGPKVAAQTHPLYDLFKLTWQQLAHVREGTGGFLSVGNDSYLVAHPREWLDHSARVNVTDANGVMTTQTTLNPNPRKPSPKLIARRKLARYENVASAIMEAKKSVLFREQPTRRIGADPNKSEQASPLEDWWQNVDGDDTHIDDAIAAWWDLAGTFGHVVLYFDLADVPDGTATAADQGWPYVRVYTPLDVLDWRRDDEGRLVWIKLLEAIQPVPTAVEGRGVITYRVRVVDETSWALYDQKAGSLIDSGDHNLGRLPVVYLFGKRRALLPDIGEAVIGDPRNHIDLFNLQSEKRELLRNQTFSFINLPLGTGADAMTVDQAQAMMGQQTGTMNVLFSAQAASILTADASNVQSYEDAIANSKREIYREAGMQWESDSKDAEAQGSLELKREEMTTRVAAYADECQQAEYGLVDLWYRWKYGEDQGPERLTTDDVQIHYPERFAQTPFQEILDQGLAAQQLGMPAIFLKELRKALVTKFEGMANLSPKVLEEIAKAIDDAPDDPTPAEKQRQKMELLTASVKSGEKPPAGASNLEAA
jgi:hypothetical protein